jgi:hypothetical protein
MTKKDLTALLIAFLGAWVMFRGLLNLYDVIASVIGYFGSSRFQDAGMLALITVGVSILNVLLYGGLAIFIIRKSGRLAESLLHYAKIGADERIEGISFTSFLPIAISLLGLYFIVTYLPWFVITSVKWFMHEANTAVVIPGENIAQLIQKEQQTLLNEGGVLVVAFFFFLRADLLAKLAGKYRKTSRQLPETTPTVIESPAAQEPRQM